MKHSNLLPTTSSFLELIDESFNEEIAPVKDYLRTVQLKKRIKDIVYKKYAYVRNKLTRVPENVKLCAMTIIEDLYIYLEELEPLEKLKLVDLKDIDLLNHLCKKCPVGYYYC